MLKDRKINRIKQVEMSPEAIDRRLLDLAQLYKLGMAIQNARRIGKVNENKPGNDSCKCCNGSLREQDDFLWEKYYVFHKK